MHCIACDKDVQPAIDIGENGRPRAVCPTCQQMLGSALSATDQPEPDLAPPAPSTQAAAGAVRRAGGPIVFAPATPVDLVAAAKDRLAVIDTELERLGALQRERRKLAAMIAAADTADEDDVVALAVRRSSNGPTPRTLATTVAAEATLTAAE